MALRHGFSHLGKDTFSHLGKDTFSHLGKDTFLLAIRPYV